MVEGLASRNPTILVAEDLHWADASTLEMLRLLVSSAPQLPLLGLFTARPEFEAPWAGERAAGLVEVSRLDARGRGGGARRCEREEDPR